jgi:hypothetical protein
LFFSTTSKSAGSSSFRCASVGASTNASARRNESVESRLSIASPSAGTASGALICHASAGSALRVNTTRPPGQLASTSPIALGSNASTCLSRRSESARSNGVAR